MANKLDFQKNGSGEWSTSFVSSGNSVVELERSESGVVTVRASIDGMAEVPVAQFQNGFTHNVIFQVNVPVGVVVTIVSQSEVTKASMLVAE